VSARDVSAQQMEQIRADFDRSGYPHQYYVEFDDPSDQPYHNEHGGQLDEKLPIYILDEQSRLQEISRVSEIVRSLSGLHKEKQPLLFYPVAD
jgi:HD superfamily phosphohydrolase